MDPEVAKVLKFIVFIAIMVGIVLLIISGIGAAIFLIPLLLGAFKS